MLAHSQLVKTAKRCQSFSSYSQTKKNKRCVVVVVVVVVI